MLCCVVLCCVVLCCVVLCCVVLCCVIKEIKIVISVTCITFISGKVLQYCIALDFFAIW